MKFDQRALDLLNAVLSYERLTEGGSSILRLDDHSAPGLTIFRLQLAGLSTPLREALVLLEQDPREFPELAKSLLRRLKTPRRRQVVVVPDERQGAIEAMKDGQSPITLDELYGRLARVPDSLPRLIHQKGRRDFNHAHFRDRYQERYIEVLHSPEPWWKPGSCRPATEYLLDWARTSTQRHPVIFLGERGTGKTWQFFRFCQSVFDLHRKTPWSFGPAYYLELRDETLYANPFGLSAGLFSDAILRNYPSVRYVLDSRLLEAFLAAGHTSLCLDGFEEIPQVIQGDETVALGALRRICAALPLGSRFLVACRAAQFGTLDRMLSLKVWPNAHLGDAFEVVQLKPFNEVAVSRYIRAVGEGDTARVLGRIFVSGKENQKERSWSSEESVKEAVRICCSYPALLAAMVERKSIAASDGPLSGVDFLDAALVGGIITHNIKMGKTTDTYFHPRMGTLHLGTRERLEILGELTWHLAARGGERVDLRSAPPRIRFLYGLDLEEVQKDLRTHTLLEILPAPRKFADGEDLGDAARIRDDLRLAVRPVDIKDATYFPQASQASGGPSSAADLRKSLSSRGLQLTRTALAAAPIGVTSVSGAFLLARHISRRLRLLSWLPEAPTPVGSIKALDRWRPLGGVPLSPPSAGLLREMLGRSKTLRKLWSSGDPRGIFRAAVGAIAGAASRGDFSLYSPSLRYLGHNLEAMGLVSVAEREKFDPWISDHVAQVFGSPSGLTGYDMVLVPPAPVAAAPETLRQKGLRDPPPGVGGPLLLGIREVTNQDFRCFLESREGAEWKVNRMTLAGSFGRKERSAFSRFANEYYLYFWQYDERAGQHEPAPDALNHPVVYISWHACAAFCNWLSGNERRTGTYAHIGLPEVYPEPGAPGYRLPSAAEWSWGARGFRLDVEYPWELYPLVLPEKTAPLWLSSTLEKSCDQEEEEARDWLRKGRRAYQELLTTSAKEHVPVLSDPLGSVGISGLMGNVKEWCHDTVDNEDLEERAILGATSLLGSESYHFNYGTSLFPQNTNPDVGFRVCRPLSSEERGLLQHHEARIARTAHEIAPSP